VIRQRALGGGDGHPYFAKECVVGNARHVGGSWTIAIRHGRIHRILSARLLPRFAIFENVILPVTKYVSDLYYLRDALPV
jgi:hypothetical protein